MAVSLNIANIFLVSHILQLFHSLRAREINLKIWETLCHIALGTVR